MKSPTNFENPHFAITDTLKIFWKSYRIYLSLQEVKFMKWTSYKLKHTTIDSRLRRSCTKVSALKLQIEQWIDYIRRTQISFSFHYTFARKQITVKRKLRAFINKTEKITRSKTDLDRIISRTYLHEYVTNCYCLDLQRHNLVPTTEKWQSCSFQLWEKATFL